MSEVLLELGRLVYVNYGPLSGKVAVVVDLINANRVIIDGPGLGVSRQVISNKRLTLTRFRLADFDVNDSHKVLEEKLKKSKLLTKFNSIGLGKKIQKQKRRAELTDFERFKAMVLKRRLSKAIRTHVNKNRRKLVSQAK